MGEVGRAAWADFLDWGKGWGESEMGRAEKEGLLGGAGAARRGRLP